MEIMEGCDAVIISLTYSITISIYFIPPTFWNKHIDRCWLRIRSATCVVSTICNLWLTYYEATLRSRLSWRCFYWYITPRVIVVYHVIISLPIHVLGWNWTLYENGLDVKSNLVYVCIIIKTRALEHLNLIALGVIHKSNDSFRSL